MNENQLYLKTPNIDELDYRIKICADKNTMDYNKGYGDDGTGCYYITQEEAREWHRNWANCKNDYYAYVVRVDNDCPVGEVNFHFDSKRQKYFIGVVIEACHRGCGYSTIALDLLAKKAFEEYGITELYNDFPPSRIAAEKAHRKVGFERLNDELIVLTADRYEKRDQNMTKTNLEKYLQNPCSTCATAFWKSIAFSIPKEITVAHENNCENSSSLTSTKYFKLSHNLEHINSDSKTGFYFQTVDLSNDLEMVKNILDICYDADYSIEEIISWTKYPVFDNNLWIFVVEQNSKKPAALGIADFDRNVKEGSLEWIQVLPTYSGMGIGQMLVNELLRRLKGKANFVTVSGQCDNKTKPELLYRKCGFTGNDIWCVTYNN